MKWRSRHELPLLKKLDAKFDVERLHQELEAMETQKEWDGLESEYKGLCDSFAQLPPFFLKEKEQVNQYASYTQLALTEFDETFDLSQRQDKSGSFWDHSHPHKSAKADERFYRKLLPNLPPYLKEVMAYFQPYLQRTRFAKLGPYSQVLPHVDYDTRYSIRIHIPIRTSPECLMGVETNRGERVEMHLPADGSVYFVNQGHKHWATNPTANPRVHLILSVDSQRFLD